MERQDRGGALRTHLAQDTSRNTRQRPGNACRDLRQRPCAIACNASRIHRVLRSPWPPFTKERRDMRP